MCLLQQKPYRSVGLTSVRPKCAAEVNPTGQVLARLNPDILELSTRPWPEHDCVAEVDLNRTQLLSGHFPKQAKKRKRSTVTNFRLSRWKQHTRDRAQAPNTTARSSPGARCNPTPSRRYEYDIARQMGQQFHACFSATHCANSRRHIEISTTRRLKSRAWPA